MVNLLLVAIFITTFGSFTWRRFEWGLFSLFFLLPAYLIRFPIGPVPSTLLEIMLLTLVGVWFFKDKNYLSLPKHIKDFYTTHKLLFWGIAFFVLGATISIFTSVNIRSAAGEWRAFYIEPILLFFIIFFFLKKFDIEKRKHIVKSFIIFPLVLCGLVTSLLCIYQHFTGFFVPHAFWANRATYRVTGWYGFPNAVGLFLAPLLPLALHLIKEYWKKNTTRVIVSSVSIITNLLAIVFAKGSGPLIGIAGGIGVLLLSFKKTRWPAIGLGVVSLVAIFLLPTNNPVKQELFAQNYSGKLRRDIWSETVNLLKDRPIFGTGIASYEERIVPYRGDHWIEVFHHPHNIFLTIWVNTGLIGLIGFVIILLSFFQNIQKNISDKKFFLASMVVLLTIGLVDSPYIKNDLAILFWILMLL